MLRARPARQSEIVGGVHPEAVDAIAQVAQFVNQGSEVMNEVRRQDGSVVLAVSAQLLGVSRGDGCFHEQRIDAIA